MEVLDKGLIGTRALVYQAGLTARALTLLERFVNP